MTYNLRYEIQAETRLEAIDKATGLLRSNVRLRGVIKAEPAFNGFWTVVLSVWEDV
jgi:hypothetical protein